MIIRNNTMGLRAYNANRKTTNSIKKNLEKLSSGYRINRSADDAAGLAVSERLRAKVTELDRCQDNAAEGIDLARTADAALQEVNDMLKRARSLCIQAENGTYSDQELSAISDEMNHLFGEIDRISAGSYHNSICLFRQGVGHTYHEEYDEHFTGMGDEALQQWGEVDFIESKEFEEAVDATPATATFTLDDSVDPDDPKTLEGKALTIGNRTYYFTAKTGSTLPPGATAKVQIAGTMEQTLKNLVNASRHYDASALDDVYDISDASIDGREVTLKAGLRALEHEVNGIPFPAEDGNAQWAHGTSVKSPTGLGTLDTIDGTDATDNQPVYEVPVTLEYSMGKSGSSAIGDTDYKDLVQNTFVIHKRTNGSSSYTSDVSIQLSSLGFTKDTTWDEFGTKLAAALHSKNSKYTATYSNGKLTIQYNADPKSPTVLRTSVQTKTTGGTDPTEEKTWTSQDISSQFKVTQNSRGSLEGGREQCTIKVPSLTLKNGIPLAFRVNGSLQLYYNLNDPEYEPYVGKDDYYLSGHNIYTGSRNVGSSASATQVAGYILSYVKSAVGVDNADFNVVGDEIVITAKKPGISDKIKNSLSNIITAAGTYTIKGMKRGTDGTTSLPVINKTNVYSKEQNVSITFDLGADVKDLAGKGFSISNPISYGSFQRYNFEFINSENGKSLRDDYTGDIDLKNITTFEGVREAVQKKLGNPFTVTLDTSAGNKLVISKKTDRYEDYDSIRVTDGVLGMDQLSKGGPVKFEGGIDTNHSQTSIDFSEINEDNLDTLLGKGFRINCATCPGEYINVFFCWTDNGEIPRAFPKLDPTTGEMRTIHNIPVELSKITSGDKIVEDIVRQVKPSLNHFTDVAVGDPPTTLIAMEKRIGDVTDGNTLYLGSVVTGVETNFVYSVDKKWVMDPLEGDLDKLQTSEVNIYVGSDPEPQLIPIHLPYIDLYHLRLAPPERVDLTDASQSASDWLDRVDRADLAISDARGTIGADFNCLEHAIQDLSNAHIQLSDAYSVIRDADVAELMMKQVKDQILLQTQQSMLSQANQAPQGVLQLMQ